MSANTNTNTTPAKAPASPDPRVIQDDVPPEEQHRRRQARNIVALAVGTMVGAGAIVWALSR